MQNNKAKPALYTVYIYRGHEQSEQPLTIYNVVHFATAPHGVFITCERHDETGDHEATYSIKHSGFTRVVLAG